FAGLAVAAMFLGRRVYANLQAHAPVPPTLNRRGTEHIGAILRLETAIVGGTTRAPISDTTWKILGPDVPAGTTVRVVAVEGAALRVVVENGG
ncbi:MAG: NfeD family protein, partial [Alphaproteobacteria bacterium]|nr:NfeD family protein [Alphaproteobacteria bacterium]